MAKLNVKVIDMVNGEITKVAYDGAEYAKTDDTRETAKVSDLFLATKKKRDITEGAFYEVISDNLGRSVFGDINILDDADDTHDTALSYGVFYRKISAQTSPTIEERVGALEADVAAIKGEAKADTIEFEGDKYRKVEREAREGDVIVLSEEQANATASVTAGKPYKVRGHGDGGQVSFIVDDGDDYNVYANGSRNRTRENVAVYEKVAEKPRKIVEGDIVVITANNALHANKIGDIGKVGEEKPLRDGGVCVYVPNGPTSAIRTLPKDIRLATAEEIAQYERVVAKAQFKVGDYVKIVKSHIGLEGTFAKITEVGDFMTAKGDAQFVIEHLPRRDGRYAVDYTQIVKATDDEVASAKEKVEEIAKWAKIGRKPGEVKVGDIIEITEDMGGAPAGHVAKVTEIGKQFGVGTRIYYDYYGKSKTAHFPTYKLIAPVESTLK